MCPHTQSWLRPHSGRTYLLLAAGSWIFVCALHLQLLYVFEDRVCDCAVLCCEDSVVHVFVFLFTVCQCFPVTISVSE